MLLLVARGEPGQEVRGVMARDADNHGGRNASAESTWFDAARRHQDRADHDGDREGQQRLQDLALIVHRHEGQESAGHDVLKASSVPEAPN